MLDGKVAIVTGGGQGLGRAVALVLAERGVAVTITGRTAAKLDAVVAEIEASGGTAQAVTGDVSDRDRRAGRRRRLPSTPTAASTS